MTIYRTDVDGQAKFHQFLREATSGGRQQELAADLTASVCLDRHRLPAWPHYRSGPAG